MCTPSGKKCDYICDDYLKGSLKNLHKTQYFSQLPQIISVLSYNYALERKYSLNRWWYWGSTHRKCNDGRELNLYFHCDRIWNLLFVYSGKLLYINSDYYCYSSNVGIHHECDKSSCFWAQAHFSFFLLLPGECTRGHFEPHGNYLHLVSCSGKSDLVLIWYYFSIHGSSITWT